MVWAPPTPQFKSINSLALSLHGQLSHPYVTTGKTIALTRRTFAGKVTSLLFNTLSGFVVALLPRSKSFKSCDPNWANRGPSIGGRMLEEESSLSLWLQHVCDKSCLSSHGGTPPRQGRMGFSKRDRASVDPSSRKQVISFESWHFSVSSSDMRFFSPWSYI